VDQYRNSLEGAQDKAFTLTYQHNVNPEQLREVLKHIVEIGATLRLQMDTDALLKRVAAASCDALGFRHSALYLSDGAGNFWVRATSGINEQEEAYLQQHPLPDNVVAQLISEEYRISDSYFIPAETPIWQNPKFASYFIIVNDDSEPPSSSGPSSSPDPVLNHRWHPEDLMVVPLVSGDNTMLGFLTPDSPLNGLRPNAEVMSLFELFTNQAAVVIEGARLYSELREALKQAQESERIKNQFLMMASHELRTPLTSVQGYIELLSAFSDALDDSTKTRFLNHARRACEELVLLLGNIMDASRIDQDRVMLKLGPMRVALAVELVLEILEPIIAREERSVEIRIPDYFEVWADELRLRQILLNLVGNALKYTPAGTGLEISAESINLQELYRRIPLDSWQIPIPDSGCFVVVAVRDWGHGIALEDQSQLFSKFVRLNEAMNSTQRGAGLGLYLCRQLTEAMGGYIWLRSSGIPGEGSTFFVALPLYRR
jgi:signal transduction histidine kinase